MLGFKIGDSMSDEEKKLFTEEERNITYDDLFEIIRGEKGSFAETAGGDVEKALILMKVVARIRGLDTLSSIQAYLYNNTLENETEFQMKVQSAVVKDIRTKAGLSQQEMSDLCEIKKRTIENWEQGERKITRCALDYLIARSRANEEDLYSMVQFHTDDEELSEETLSLLKRLSECEFTDIIDGHKAGDYPLVRYINRSMMTTPEFLIRVEGEEYITDGKVTHKQELFPEDLRKIMDYATDKNCDEVYIKRTNELSSYSKHMIEAVKGSRQQ